VNISSLIASFATGTYTVTRRTRGTVSYGKIADGTTSTFTITASVSPAAGRDLQKLPEGMIANSAFAVITTTQLYTSNQAGADVEGGYQPDSISIEGVSHLVEHVERWQDSSSGDVGYRCIVRDGDL
jgi:hypothetical protein